MLYRLIKVPFHDRKPENPPEHMNSHLQMLGRSKIKALQNGQAQHGIYRSFCKSASSTIGKMY